MKYKNLGKTGIEVSAVSMGCWAIVGDRTWGTQDEKDSINTLRTALEVGINFFDTAEAYGNGYSEELLGKAFNGRRTKAVIATKAVNTNLSANELVKACEESLKRLQTDYIDLYYIHWPNRNIPFEETMSAMDQLLKAGKIRAAGVCNFGAGDLENILNAGNIEVNQMAYNLLFRAIEFEIKPKCIEAGIGIISYSSIAQGLLTGKFKCADEVPEGRARTRLFNSKRPQASHTENGCEQEVFEALDKIRSICIKINEPMEKVALAWLLHQTGVTSVIAGARSIKQVMDNARGADLEFSQEIINELSAATEPVKKTLGPNPDMWLTESRIK